jgi:hypothetical protein
MIRIDLMSVLFGIRSLVIGHKKRARSPRAPPDRAEAANPARGGSLDQIRGGGKGGRQIGGGRP